MKIFKNINTKLLIFIGVLILFTDLSVIFNIPFLRQLFSFLFLTFLPGLLILYILNPGRLNLAFKVVLAVGLSAAFSMFFALLVNSILMALGYDHPLATIPLLISFSLANIVLAVIAAFKGKEVSLFSVSAFQLTTREKLLLLIPTLLPLMSILGVRNMNFQSNNTLLVVTLFLILAYIIFISVINQRVSEKIYPALILLISLSVLLMYSLRSNHIIGADTHVEYYTFHVIWENMRWQATGLVGWSGGYQEVCLSIALLPVIYQTYLNIDPEYLFKIIYSLIIFFTPLAVYLIARRYLNAFYSFLAAIFFLSNTVFLWTPSDIRSNIAIFFFALAILALLHNDLSRLSKKALFIIFMAACIVSHYSSTYVFFFTILLAWLFAFLISVILPRLRKIKTPKDSASLAIEKLILPKEGQNVTPWLVALFFTLLFFWYSQITGVSFTDGVNFIHYTFTKLGELFMLEARAPGLVEAFGKVPAYYEAWLLRTEVVFSWLTVALIMVGIIIVLWRFRSNSLVPQGKERDFLITRFDIDFMALTFSAIVILAASVILPYVADGYGVSRQHLQAMVILAPFLVIGGITIGRAVKATAKYLVVLLVLIPYFMCTSGLMYQVFHYPKAIVLNDAGVAYDTMYIHDQESLALRWLGEKSVEGQNIFSERSRLVLSQVLIPSVQTRSLINALQNNEDLDGYVYLRYLNIVYNKYIGADQLGHDIPPGWINLIKQNDKIYANTGSQIFR